MTCVVGGKLIYQHGGREEGTGRVHVGGASAKEGVRGGWLGAGAETKGSREARGQGLSIEFCETK